MRPSNESIAKAFWEVSDSAGITLPNPLMNGIVARACVLDASAQDVAKVSEDMMERFNRTYIFSLQSQLTETQRELNGARAMLASERSVVEHLRGIVKAMKIPGEPVSIGGQAWNRACEAIDAAIAEDRKDG